MRHDELQPDVFKIDWIQLKKQLRQLTKGFKFGLLLLIFAIGSFSIYLPVHVNAAPAHMMLFWDPANGAAPTGWSVETSFDGRFPQGESVANYGVTGGDGVYYLHLQK